MEILGGWWNQGKSKTTHFLSKNRIFYVVKKYFCKNLCLKHFQKNFNKNTFLQREICGFFDKKCVFNFCQIRAKFVLFSALISPTTQNLHFFDLSKKWNVSKSRITLVVWAKNYVESFSIIWESFHKKTFFFLINFDFSISKQNYAGSCVRSR